MILHFSRKLWDRLGRSLIVIFGWTLIVSYAALVHAGNNTFTTDFNQDFEPGNDTEQGNHYGWEPHGEAFKNQPIRGDSPSAGQHGERPNHQGKWLIGTFERNQGSPAVLHCPNPVQGDKPKGWLQSSNFTIPAASLSFLIGGGAAFETRVELIVLNEGGDVEFRENRAFYASGRNSETMRPVIWQLDRYEGAQGFIRIVDDSSEDWGHIKADDFKFIPRQPIIDLVRVPGGWVERGTGISLVLGPPPPPPVTPPPPLKFRVPSVIGMSEEDATRVLLGVRLSRGNLVEHESREERTGTVIEQDPPPGSEVDVGQVFNLVVTVEPEKVLVSVPDLTGLFPKQAGYLLAEYQLLPGEVTTTPAPGEENRIISQQPPPGRRVETGTSVGMVVIERSRKKVITRADIVVFHDRCFINDRRLIIDRWIVNDRWFVNDRCLINVFWAWIWILVAIALILAAAVVSFDTSVEFKLSFKPHPDPGKAGIGPGHSLGPDIELRLRPVKDAGVQRVDSPDDLVQNENMNHE